jgi:hypothetical protein
MQEYGVDLALASEVQNPTAGHMRDYLGLVRRHPLRTPAHGLRKVAVLHTDKPSPFFHDELLEGFMKESEFAPRQNSKQVAIEVPVDLAEVEIGRIAGFRWEHASQDSAQRPRPIFQHGRGSAPDLGCHAEVCGGEELLLPAQPVLFLYGTDE